MQRKGTETGTKSGVQTLSGTIERHMIKHLTDPDLTRAQRGLRLCLPYAAFERIEASKAGWKTAQSRRGCTISYLFPSNAIVWRMDTWSASRSIRIHSISTEASPFGPTTFPSNA